jgi:hypothetical protein
MRHVLVVVVAVLLAGIGAAGRSAAQQAPRAPAAGQEEPAEPDISRIERLRQELEREGGAEFAPTIVSPDILDEAGAAALRQALTSYYQYRVSGYEHRQRVFAWQLLSSRIIFVLVIFLVLVGVYFSWLQFRLALRAAPAGEPRQETTFEASASGLKVSSPVLGVIILAISLAFFYLYLVHVYPIAEIL